MVTVVSEQISHGWGETVHKRLDGESYYFVSFDEYKAKRRADIFESLWLAIDGVDIVDQDVIPIKVAREGKAAIASYLYSVHLKSIGNIAEILKVSPSTVEQYLTDVKAGRRL
ncbi:hypothetical protein [Natronorubrum halophilum]|uniref:hypothetical protein n=1 Tax=Natronorubrum halophilum TaxID=1702106 RepID=UPI0013CF1CCE|nr:hypothetical protein [Natronorubrum halophilum]